MMENVKRLQDSDCHWYWIPLGMVEQFKKDNENLSGKDYMDDPDSFDGFIEKYDDYRTYGAPDIMPGIFAIQKNIIKEF